MTGFARGPRSGATTRPAPESGLARWVARHDTAVFLAVTFGVSWPLWLVSGALSRTPVRAPDLRWLVAQIGVFAPALAGMVVGACTSPGGARRAVRLVAFLYVPAAALGAWIAMRGFESFAAVDAATTWAMVALGAWILVALGTGRNRLVPWPGRPAGRAETIAWSAGCILGTAALLAAAWAMTAAEPASGIPVVPVRDVTVPGLVSAFAINLAYGGSLGEEPGWRGAWLPRLLQRHPPLAASLVISFWWALWHAPVDLSQGFGAAGAGALVVRQVWTLPLTIVFTWVTLRGGGSLLPPLALHTTLNTFPDFAAGQPGRLENAMSSFWLLSVLIAVIVAAADPRLRRMVPLDAAQPERTPPAGV